MRQGATRSRGSRLNRYGIRASAGPWTIYADRVGAHRGTLIVALGRTAGSAVTRSRIRRIARDAFRKFEAKQAAPLNVLLLARGDVSSRPRRQVRADFSGLAARAFGALARREDQPTGNA